MTDAPKSKVAAAFDAYLAAEIDNAKWFREQRAMLGLPPDAEPPKPTKGAKK